jgi:predicted ribosome quality control (RQC) complex YloA/Tae2 family protein
MAPDLLNTYGGKMLSLRELQRAVRILQEKIMSSRLRRIIQPDPLKLVLTFETSSCKWHVLVACGSNNARIGLTDRAEADVSSGSFYEYLRAHLIGGVLTSIECSPDNRQVSLKIQMYSESFALILSILGSRSNIYLLDSGDKLLHSLRALDETRNELKLGDAWVNPQGSVPSDGIDRWQELPDEQFLDALEQTYQRLEQRNRADLLARRVQQALKKEKVFLDRKLTNLQEDLGEAKQAEAYKQKGELLKNVLHTIRHGDDKVIATDFATGEAVEIPLDPKVSPAANLELYFARYQKQSRGTLLIQQQLEELGTKRSELDVIDQRLEEALRSELPDMQALERVEALPTIRRLIHRYFPERKPVPRSAHASSKKEIPTRLLPKRYKTQEGLEIWVGRNDEGNDYLTTRLSRGNDLFFHLEGYPGSHVILRTEGRSDPPPKSILDACELAVHYSKLKSADRADVHVAPVKNVKKPKGAKPGLVYVRSGRTIHLKRDSKRLQSILASRLD